MFNSISIEPSPFLTPLISIANIDNFKLLDYLSEFPVVLISKAPAELFIIL